MKISKSGEPCTAPGCKKPRVLYGNSESSQCVDHGDYWARAADLGYAPPVESQEDEELL